MVCGSFNQDGQATYAGCAMPPPGVWHLTNTDIAYHAPLGAQGWSTWSDNKIKVQVPRLVIPGGPVGAQQMETETLQSPAATSAASAPEPLRSGPSAARAAKRQRGRERRKFFKAAAHAAVLAQEENRVPAEEQQATCFEARAAALAAEVRLVVRKTFFEVDSEDSSSSADSEIDLPPALFSTTPEVNEWRRDYRRFRLGHHQGAKGEVTAFDRNVPALCLRMDMDLLSKPCAAIPA